MTIYVLTGIVSWQHQRHFLRQNSGCIELWLVMVMLSSLWQPVAGRMSFIWCPAPQVRRQLEATTGPAGERLLAAGSSASGSTAQVAVQLTSRHDEEPGRSAADSGRHGSDVKRKRKGGAHRNGDLLVV